MKKIIISILVLFAFTWTPVVSADQSPESLVTCTSFVIDGIFTYAVAFSAISSEINAEMCAYTSLCNPCIESLEEQRCKVVDLKLDHKMTTDPDVWASYTLSCKAP